MSLPQRVLRTVQTHRMIPAGGRVLVALSGGSDSVALALLVRELEARGGWQLAGIAHLNHALREAADADEEFCRAWRRAWACRSCPSVPTIRELAREQHRSIEDAARQARYAFLERARESLAADVVATGHTRDDQAETFLLRLIRGAGTRGLAGVLPVAGRVVRPLIDDPSRGAAQLSGGERSTVSRGRDQRGRVDPAESRPARADSVHRARVFEPDRRDARPRGRARQARSGSPAE